MKNKGPKSKINHSTDSNLTFYICRFSSYFHLTLRIINVDQSQLYVFSNFSKPQTHTNYSQLHKGSKHKKMKTHKFQVIIHLVSYGN